MRLKPLECSPLFIPSGFNESTQFWKIDGLTNYANVSVKLYDRWGDEVFTNTDNYAANPFDGTSKGTPLPSGVYYYVISADGLTKTGTLTLLR
jgi:gliding motility-associated-like protein